MRRRDVDRHANWHLPSGPPTVSYTPGSTPAPRTRALALALVDAFSGAELATRWDCTVTVAQCGGAIFTLNFRERIAGHHPYDFSSFDFSWREPVMNEASEAELRSYAGVIFATSAEAIRETWSDRYDAWTARPRSE